MVELRATAAILDAGVEEEELQTALQALLFHQCLYEDWPHAPAYRLLARHLAHVQPIMDAFGWRLRHHPAAQMLALEPRGPIYGAHLSRLRKDETVVLLILRLLYEEGLSSLDERGRVEITTDDVHDRLRAAGEEPPAMQRLEEILRAFHRKGLVRVGDRDPVEQLLVATVMPGITLLVPDVYVDAVTRWAEARREAGRIDPDAAAGTGAQNSTGEAASMLAQVAAARASLGAAAEPPPPTNDEQADAGA